MNHKNTIVIVAPSSVVPAVELNNGVNKLKDNGYNVKIHPQCKKKYLFFAGKDVERADALWQMSKDEKYSIIYSARGGSGSTKILDILDQKTKRFGAPKQKKLFVGLSDATSLIEFVANKWHWHVLHAPMPAMPEFMKLEPKCWSSLMAALNKDKNFAPSWSCESFKLKNITTSPKAQITAKIKGGNLSLLAALCGTPYSIKPKGCFLFIEDIWEPLYKIDRMVTQLHHAGVFDGIKGIILGEFLECKDIVNQVLAKEGLIKNSYKPLRPAIPTFRGLMKIFADIGKSYNIPVAYGLPVGHGPKLEPLPMGNSAVYSWSKNGKFELKKWDWLNK